MSRAREVWETECADRLQQLEQIHADARGKSPGRRWYIDQLVRSLFVTLVGQFQVYCRELHNEAISVYIASANKRQVEVLETLLKQGRKLESQNPHRSSLGSDFGRLGFDFIDALKRCRSNSCVDLERLDLLVKFRNAIVHGNESQVQSLVKDNQTRVTLSSYRKFRKTLDRIAQDMDTVVAEELAAGLKVRKPW